MPKMERYVETQIDNYLNYLERDDIHWFETPNGEQFDLMQDGSWVCDELKLKLTTRKLAERAVNQELAE